MSESQPFDLASMMESAMAAKQAADEVEAEGTSGGGAVKVTLSGSHECLDVRIDPSVVDPTDVDMLADLILVAFNDAAEQVANAQAQVLSQQMFGGMDLGGIDLGGLLGD